MSKVFDAISLLILSVLIPLVMISNNTFFFRIFLKGEYYENLRINYTDEKIKQMQIESINYVNLRSDLSNDFWSMEDRIHLKDVRNIFAGIYLLLISAIIYTILRLKNLEDKFIFLKNSGKILIFLIFFSIITAIFFDPVFTLMHKVLFRNDYWVLDPNSSNLIKLFPEGSFFYSSIFIFLSAIISHSFLTTIFWKHTKRKYS